LKNIECRPFQPERIAMNRIHVFFLFSLKTFCISGKRSRSVAQDERSSDTWYRVSIAGWRHPCDWRGLGSKRASPYSQDGCVERMVWNK